MKLNFLTIIFFIIMLVIFGCNNNSDGATAVFKENESLAVGKDTKEEIISDEKKNESNLDDVSPEKVIDENKEQNSLSENVKECNKSNFNFNLFRYHSLTLNQKKIVLNKLKDVKSDFIRIPLSWSGFEPEKGEYNFIYSDQSINPLIENGFKPLLICNDPPVWASVNEVSQGGHIASRAPKDVKEYANFVGVLANRYKGKGVAYEIWNEPDNPPYWGNTQSSPSDYMELLKPAYNTIKKVDSNAIIVAGAVLIQFLDEPNYDYLDELLELGILDYCDAISVHIYPNSVSEFENTFNSVVKKVREYGDNEIWITEISWFSKFFSEEKLRENLKDKGLNQVQINEFINSPLVPLFKPSKTVDEIKQKEQLIENQKTLIEKALGKYQLSFTDAEKIFSESILDDSNSQTELVKNVFDKSINYRVFWFQLYDIAFSQGLLNSDLTAKPAYNELKYLIDSQVGC